MEFSSISDVLIKRGYAFKMLANGEVVKEQWSEEQDQKQRLYQVVLVTEGQVDLQAVISDSNGASLSIRTFKKGEIILMATLDVRLPHGVELQLVSRGSSAIQGADWASFKRLAFEDEDPSAIIVSSFLTVSELINRYRAERMYSAEQRVAIAIAELIAEDQRLLNIYYNAIEPASDPNHYVRVCLSAKDVAIAWDISKPSVRNGREGLLERGVIKSRLNREEVEVDPYALKQYLSETNTYCTLAEVD